MLLYVAELALACWKLSTRWSKTAHATIEFVSRHRNNPRPTRFVDIRWIRGLGGGKLPAASYVIFPKPAKKGYFFAMGEGSRFFVACFLHSSAQRWLYQMPGRRPPPITGRFVNTVTRGWVGAPNERAPLRFHGAVAGFVDRCLSKTRNLAASN